MPPTAYLLGWVSALLVGFSKTGIPGASIPAVLLLTEAFPPEETKLAVGAMLPILLVADVFAVAWYRQHAQWDRLVRLFPYVGLGMAPGWFVLTLVEGEQLRPMIGTLVLALLVVEVARRRLDSQRIPRSLWFTAAAGTVAGFSTVVAHAAFPVMSIYLVSQGCSKRQFMGTAAWFFLVLNLIKLPLYLPAQMITAETLRYDLVVAPVALAGGLLGVWLLPRVPQRVFDLLALSLAGAAALRMVFG